MPQFSPFISLSSLNGSNGFRLDGIDPVDQSGRAVAAAGDVNGDGFDDVIIGAFGADPDGRSGAGESYVVFGKAGGFSAAIDLSTLDGTNGFRLDGIGPYDRSGLAVSSAGDINGDGYDDVIVGAYGSPSGTKEAYVVFGKAGSFAPNIELSSLDGTTGFRITGGDPGIQVGDWVASAGDVNGDGFDDFVVGAPNTVSNGNTYAGHTYVVFGKAGGLGNNVSLTSLDGSNGFRLDGFGQRELSGGSVASAGDINNDGYDDILISARGAEYGNGRTYVVFGAAGGFAASTDLSTLNGLDGFSFSGLDPQDRLGSSVASAGDVNGDGFNDIIIGAQGAERGDIFEAGEVYVVFGKASGFSASFDLNTLDGTNGFQLQGITYFDSIGHSVSSAGDVNGDGFDDILIGAYRASAGAPSSAGQSYVVFGKAESFSSNIVLSAIDGNNGFRLDGSNSFDQSGYSSAAAGDVNSDGFDDIIIGADGADPNGDNIAGSSYVVFGHCADTAVTINGTALGRTHNGGQGGDVIDGKAGADVLRGWEGVDRLIGGAGADIIDGGDGSDFASYETADRGVKLDLRDATGFSNSGDALGDTFNSIERFRLSTHDDVFYGSKVLGAANVASGLEGGDTFRSGGVGTNNTFSGGLGDDLFYGNYGTTRANGDEGDDSYIGGSGADVFIGGTGVDSFKGYAGDDVSRGGDDNDFIYGGAGVDTLYGESGDDVLNGDSENDTLHGGLGNDSIRGGSGDDRIYGGTGRDVFKGEGGADTFVFHAADTGSDRIYDFELGVDTLEFSGLIHGIDDLTITLSGGEVRIFIEPSSTVLRIGNLHSSSNVAAIVNDIDFV